MKKTLSIAVLLIFLVGNVGMTISKHYCNGELYSINVSVLVDCQNACGMEMHGMQCGVEEEGDSEECCNDKINNFRITDHYNSVSYDWKPQVTANHFEATGLQFTRINNIAYSKIKASPLLADYDIFILVQSFLC